MPWIPETIDSDILAIHAALLSTNEILYFGGDQHDSAAHNANNFDHTRLFHVISKTITPVSSLTTDVFCSGHAFLGDGRLLVGGGTEQWGTSREGGGAHGHDLNFGGHRACWLFDPLRHAWKRVKDMNPEPGMEDGGGRWYPTLITLPDGDVLAVFGHPSRSDSRHRNHTPERYSPSDDNWTLLPEIANAQDPGSEGPPLFYPRLHVLPSGNVFFVTPVPPSVPRPIPNPPYHNRVYDLLTSAFTSALILPPPPEAILYRNWSATSVLLPLLPGDGYRPRIMVCGDIQPFRIELGAAPPWEWKKAGERMGAAAGRRREHLCAVLLPTGEVFVSGGVSVPDPNPDSNDLVPEDAVLEGEIYSPGIDWDKLVYTRAETWKSTEPATVPRNYHSVALLMPNGRVWTAGSSKNAQQGNPDQVAEKRIEIFRPEYDIGGDWEPWHRIDPSITPGRTVTRRSVVWPASRNPNRLDVFVVGHDGGIYTSGRNTGGDWEPWRPIGDPAAGHTVPAADEDDNIPNSVVSAVARDPDRLDIFVVGHDGGIYTTGQDAGGAWEPWSRIDPSSTPGRTVARRSVVWPASRNPNRLDVFVVGHDGGIYTSGRNTGGDWEPWRPIGDPAAGHTVPAADEDDNIPNSVVSAVARDPDRLDIFVVGHDGGIYTTGQDAGGAWETWQPIGDPAAGRTVPHRSVVWPASRDPNRLDIFVVGHDGGIYTSGQDSDPNRPKIIESPNGVTYGEIFEVRTLTDRQAATISRVALIRAGSVTHAFDADQRYVALRYEKASGNRLTVTAPPHAGIAPPGMYMLWILTDRGLPCHLARFVRVSSNGEIPPPPFTGVDTLAQRLMNLSGVLASTDRHIEAVATAQAAVDLLRGLDPQPETQAPHWVLLAGSLWILVLRLIEAQRVSEVSTLALESIQVYRQAVAAGAEVTGIANNLLTLSSWLANAGLTAEAVSAAQTAVDVLRPFQPPDPERASYLNLLAGSLWTLVLRLIEAQRVSEVSTPALESIQVYRQAVAAGAEVTGIANNLLTLSSWLANAGLSAEAEAAADAAEEILS
jgi:hypothetical protein